MSEIKKGDLVVVVRPAAYCSCHVGLVFVVQDIAPSPDGHLNCHKCGSRARSLLDAKKPQGGWQSLSQLRKIDPDQASDHEREFDRLNRRQPEIA